MILETERLILREMAQTDFSDFVCSAINNSKSNGTCHSSDNHIFIQWYYTFTGLINSYSVTFWNWSYHDNL